MRARPTVFFAFAGLVITALFATAHAGVVGFVNIPVIMEKAPQAQAAREKLQHEFSGRRKNLEECGKELENLDQMLRREGRDMEKSRRNQMIEKVKKRRRECGDLREEFEADFNRRRSEELGKLQKQISKVIDTIAARRKFELIVGPPIIYADEQVNLTEEVLKTLSSEGR